MLSWPLRKELDTAITKPPTTPPLPLHTHMEDSTLELVSRVFSRQYQGILVRIPHKALKGPVGPLSALCARFLSPLPKS